MQALGVLMVVQALSLQPGAATFWDEFDAELDKMASYTGLFVFHHR